MTLQENVGIWLYFCVLLHNLMLSFDTESSTMIEKEEGLMYNGVIFIHMIAYF